MRKRFLSIAPNLLVQSQLDQTAKVSIVKDSTPKVKATTKSRWSSSSKCSRHPHLKLRGYFSKLMLTKVRTNGRKIRGLRYRELTLEVMAFTKMQPTKPSSR